MASHRKVPIEEFPEMPASSGRGVSKKQRLVDRELEESRDELIEMHEKAAADGNVDYTLFFEFNGSEHEELRFPSPRRSTAQDACRRMFRKAMEKLELEEVLDPIYGADGLFKSRYKFNLERLNDGQFMHRGFSVWVRVDLGDVEGEAE